MGVYNGSATGQEIDAAAEFIKGLGIVIVKAAAGRYQNGTCCYIGQILSSYYGIRIICLGNKHIDVSVVRTGSTTFTLYGTPSTAQFYVNTSDSKVYVVAPSGTIIVPIAFGIDGYTTISCTGATLPSGATLLSVTQ